MHRRADSPPVVHHNVVTPRHCMARIPMHRPWSGWGHRLHQSGRARNGRVRAHRHRARATRATDAGFTMRLILVRLFMTCCRFNNQPGRGFYVVFECPLQSLGWRKATAPVPAFIGARATAAMMLAGIRSPRGLAATTTGIGNPVAVSRYAQANAPRRSGVASHAQIPEYWPIDRRMLRIPRNELSPLARKASRLG